MIVGTAATLAGLAMAACSDQENGQAGEVAQTTSPSSVDAAATTAVSIAQTSAADTDAVANVDDLDGVAWVINDFDGLVDDQGRVLVEPSGLVLGGSRLVARSADGSNYYIIDEQLWRWPVDAAQPEPVEVDVDKITDIGYDDDGRVIVNPYGEQAMVDDQGGRPRTALSAVVDGQVFMTALNGVTVTAFDPIGPVDPEGGFLTGLDTPARLQVSLPDGSVEWTTDAGGTAAPWLSIIDFDGRYVMLARAPEEPADPAMQHIVYDLDCQAGGIAGEGCTTTFWARHGTAALVGPDRGPGDDRLNIQLLDICPTMNHEITPPVEMTDTDLASPFAAADREAFEWAAQSLAVCDPLPLGPAALNSHDDAEWLWSEFARALEGPFAQTGTNEWTWNRDPSRSSVVLINEFGQPYMEFRPADGQLPGEVAAAMSATHLLLGGQADQSLRDELVAAAEELAEQNGAEVVDLVEIGGPGHDPGQGSTFVGQLTRELGRADVVAGEVHLTDDGVKSNVVTDTTATLADEDIGFAFADFANGGESAFDQLRLAETVGLALGSDLVAWRGADQLADRSWWAVNRSSFQAFVGPFAILDFVPSPSAFVIGPHPRCAAVWPTPAPPDLVQYRRISIQPVETAGSTCLTWAAVDLFVDEDGVIHGVSLDLFEP
jgi:hypothetical protein